MTKVLLLAVQIRDNVQDMSLPVRSLIEAVGDYGKDVRPAHISVYDTDELDHDQLAQVFAPDNPDAFQTV